VDARPNAREALLAALRRIFRPLLRICFRGGISLGEIRAELDHAAVREAESYLVEINKKPTFSNISIITGIARHAVRRLMALDIEEAPPPREALHRAVRVLNGWHEDPDFTTRKGTPALLAVRGGNKSFESLALRYAGGVSYAAILERLIETNTVEVIEEDDDGKPLRVRPRQATIEPDVNTARLFEDLGVIYGDALELFDANLRTVNNDHKIRPYTVTATVAEPSLRLIRRLLRERGDSVMSAVDETLHPHELKPSEVKRLLATNDGTLYDVRVTFLATIKPTVEKPLVIEGAFRRKRDQDSAEAE
jgi:hypothetical protein